MTLVVLSLSRVHSSYVNCIDILSVNRALYAMQSVPERFETERLVLRKYQEGDERSVFEYASNEEAVKYMNWPRHLSIDDSFDFTRYAIKAFEKNLEFAFGVILKDENKFIGSTGFQLLDSETALLGFILHPDYWHKGYATEAAGCIYNWLCRHSGLKYITALCHAANSASIGVLEKIGIPYECTENEISLFPNLEVENHETMYYRKVI